MSENGSNKNDTGTPPLRSREIELDNPETFLLLQAAARAAKPLSDPPKKKGALSDASKKPLSDAHQKDDQLSDAGISLSDPMPVLSRAALFKLGILATPGRYLIFTHRGAKQICRVAK